MLVRLRAKQFQIFRKPSRALVFCRMYYPLAPAPRLPLAPQTAQSLTSGMQAGLFSENFVTNKLCFPSHLAALNRSGQQTTNQQSSTSPRNLPETVTFPPSKPRRQSWPGGKQRPKLEGRPGSSISRAPDPDTPLPLARNIAAAAWCPLSPATHAKAGCCERAGSAEVPRSFGDGERGERRRLRRGAVTSTR